VAVRYIFKYRNNNRMKTKNNTNSKKANVKTVNNISVSDFPECDSSPCVNGT